MTPEPVEYFLGVYRNKDNNNDDDNDDDDMMYLMMVLILQMILITFYDNVFFLGVHLLIKAVCAGSHHSLAITQDNELYSWGSNNFNCLGRYDIDFQW